MLALALRLAAGAWWHARHQGEFGFGDSESYWRLAESLAQQQPYQYGDDLGRVFRMPGYPLLLSGLYRLAGAEPPIIWARWLSAGLGTLAVASIYILGRTICDPHVGLAAALVVAVLPEAVASGALVLSEAPFAPLAVLHLAAWAAALGAVTMRRAMAWSFVAGVLAGGATLMRPSWLLMVPFAACVLLLLRPARLRTAALAGVMLAALALVLAPWWVRNAHLTGHFVPTTLQVGASLYDAWNPAAHGGSDMAPVDRLAARRRAEMIGLDPVETEYQLDARLRAAAVDWARQHPSEAMRLAAVKFLRMWNVWPNEAAFRGWPFRLAIACSYVPLMACAACGAWKLRHNAAAWLCWLPAVYLTLVHLVFVSSIRYRGPALLPLAVLAAAAVIQRAVPTGRPLAPPPNG